MATRSVSLIRKGDSADPVEIRVVRKWKIYAFKDDCCYLFVDKEGYAIEAHGNKRDIEHKINVGSCYRITNYLSHGHRKIHNVVPHPATMRLARGTRFQSIETVGFPENFFNFFPYEALIHRVNENFLLTDYIGRFDSITIDQQTRSGARLLKFLVEDAEERFIEVAMWGEIAQSVDIQRLNNDQFPIIVAITSLKVTEFNHVQLESTSATHMYINPDNEEARLLATSMMDRYRDAPVNNQNKQTINELLLKNPETNADRRFTCRATITDFVQHKIWYYKGCVRCNRRLSKKSEELVCGDHPDETQPKFLYCITATIEDNTGITTVTMFDDVVTSLILTPCSSLVIENGFTDAEEIPEPLHAMRGMTMLFQLRFNNRTQPGSAAFVVNQILDEEDIIQELPLNNPPPSTTATSIQQGTDHLASDEKILTQEETLTKTIQSAPFTDKPTITHEDPTPKRIMPSATKEVPKEPMATQTLLQTPTGTTTPVKKGTMTPTPPKFATDQPTTPAMPPPAKRKLLKGEGKKANQAV